MKLNIIYLFFISSLCYSADSNFLSFSELVGYVNKMEPADIKKFCGEYDSVALRQMIDIAHFDPLTVQSYSVSGDQRYGMCNIEKGVHVIIRFVVTEDNKYALKSIDSCR